MGRDRPRFAADAMLGSLARWLRLLGYDTTYERDAADERVVQLAKSQGRIVLTRDRQVAHRAAPSLYVASHDLDGQLVEVFGSMGVPVPSSIALERCSICNAPLVASDAEEARKAGVAPRVLDVQSAFWRCPSCGRTYWRGTHVTSMERRLRALKGREPGALSAPRKR